MTVNHIDRTVRGAHRTRTAIYLRSASAPQSNPDSSLVAQRRVLMAAIDQCDLELADEYSDAGIAGQTLDRFGLARLLQDACADPRPFDFVLVADFSRISRDVARVMEVATQLANLGICLITADRATASLSATSRM
jgi:DNA invertase Pin-like site-specific DNA recombinase